MGVQLLAMRAAKNVSDDVCCVLLVDSSCVYAADIQAGVGGVGRRVKLQ